MCKITWNWFFSSNEELTFGLELIIIIGQCKAHDITLKTNSLHIKFSIFKTDREQVEYIVMVNVNSLNNQ